MPACPSQKVGDPRSVNVQFESTSSADPEHSGRQFPGDPASLVEGMDLPGQLAGAVPDFVAAVSGDQLKETGAVAEDPAAMDPRPCARPNKACQGMSPRLAQEGDEIRLAAIQLTESTRAKPNSIPGQPKTQEERQRCSGTAEERSPAIGETSSALRGSTRAKQGPLSCLIQGGSSARSVPVQFSQSSRQPDSGERFQPSQVDGDRYGDPASSSLAVPAQSKPAVVEIAKDRDSEGNVEFVHNAKQGSPLRLAQEGGPAGYVTFPENSSDWQDANPAPRQPPPGPLSS